MSMSHEARNDKVFLTRAVEATVRIGLLVILAAWCFQIIQPFIVPIAWGMIIAVAAYPAYRMLLSAVSERRGLASTLVTLLMLILLIVPSLMLAETLVSGAQGLAENMRSGTLKIPPPPPGVSSWPLVGKPLEELWSLASVNLQAALQEVAPHLKVVGDAVVSAAAGAGLGILQFVVAIVIAGVLLYNAEAGGRAARLIGSRLAGEQGVEFTEVAEATVRSVARGILGVALIQSLLAGLGLLAAGVPAAGLWALLCLLLAVIQIGIILVLIPVIIYLFSTADTFTAVAFLIWSILIAPLDNILKPILLGRGVAVPMVVIFLGAIGGFLASGIIGLFVGAVVLALGYKLFLAWLTESPQPAQTLKAAHLAPTKPTSSSPTRNR